MATWNPSQYLKFADERLQPAVDLLARVPLADLAQVIDLGCGTGNATGLLRDRWPRARVIGVDSSGEMLARARAEVPGIEWACHDIGSWTPSASPDLVFSNAALHWLPRHDALFARLMSWLAPGGTLAVQMPRNFRAPSHALLADVVEGGPWRARLEPLLRPEPVHDPACYLDWLQPLSSRLAIWETEYLHVLTGADPVKEWIKATWLKPFLDALDRDHAPAFESEYARLLRPAYPRRPDGTTLFPFRRLFVVAQRRM